MNKGIKLMATCMVAFALAFGVLAPAEDITAEDQVILISPGPADVDDKLTLEPEAQPLAKLDKKKSSPYGENYVHWFSLAIVALLALLALAYLHVKAHKK